MSRVILMGHGFERFTKMILLFLLASFCLNCEATDVEDVTNEMVAYYPFNGNANDESGNGNHGSVFGATLTSDRFGNPISAYEFDGINDYIVTPLDINISVMPELTMSVWLYPRRTGPEDDGVVDHGRRHVLSSDDGDLDRSLVVKLGYWEIQMGGDRWISGFPVDLNTWQHIVVIFGTSEVKFYIDGVQLQILFFSGFSSTMCPLTFGDNASRKWYQPYDGIVDDVRIYNYTLSSSEIQELYNEAD